MPRKTKRDKIIATYHKKIKYLEKQLTTEKNIIVEEEKIEPERQIDQSPNDQQFVEYFFSDLKKSLILISLIISVEIGLYYASINNYFK